jgi:hypothetical protein
MRTNGSAFVTATSTTTLLRSAQLAATAALLLLSAEAASASTVTINGNYTLTTSNRVGNAPTIGYQLNHTSFSEILTPGTATGALGFFSTGPAGSCGTGCVNNTASENITVNMNFTEAGTGATGSLSITGTYVAKYSGSSLPCATGSQGLSQTDCVYWHTGAWNSTSNDPVVDAVTLSNNDILNVTFYSAEDWTIFPKIGFETPVGSGGHSTATPLPAALPLFVSGLGGLGLFGWRRKRKAPAIAA